MNLLEKIRAATHSHHQSLDNALIPCLKNVQSKEDYAAILIAFYGFFKPVYDRIDAYVDINFLPDYNSRRKPEWIIKDLDALGIDYFII